MKPLQENSNLFNFQGVIGRRRYFINLALLLVGFIAVGSMVVIGLFLDRKLALELRPSNFSAGLYITALTLAVPLLYMSWINKFKRIRDIRGTQEKEKLWFGLWVLLGLVPYSGLLLSVALGLMKGKVTGSGNISQ